MLSKEEAIRNLDAKENFETDLLSSFAEEKVR